MESSFGSHLLTLGVLGPLFFSLYNLLLGILIATHGFNHPFYTNDSSNYTANTNLSSELQPHIDNCLVDISNWVSCRHLKPNLPTQNSISFPPNPPLFLSLAPLSFKSPKLTLALSNHLPNLVVSASTLSLVHISLSLFIQLLPQSVLSLPLVRTTTTAP